jgi:hypothetical protein
MDILKNTDIYCTKLGVCLAQNVSENAGATARSFQCSKDHASASVQHDSMT